MLRVRALNRGVLQAQSFSYQYRDSISRRCWSTFRAGDRILLTWVSPKGKRRKLSKPLRHQDATIVDNHEIPHDQIIGQFPYLYIEKTTGRRIVVKADHPSLDEFISLSPRRVAPIYASYAATIVDQLDLHLPPPSDSNDPEKVGGPSFQILEAGTGHGGLTIHLARAIAAANPPPPQLESSVELLLSEARTQHESATDAEAQKYREACAVWRKERRAIVHTVDVDRLNSQHAESTIRTFRNGLYTPHIDFYTADVQHWVNSRMSGSSLPFLDVVVLDMPRVHDKFAVIANALRPGGQLLVFMPQVTQIASCVQMVKDEKLPFTLTRVVELGEGISNGRLWDIRVANLKSAEISHLETGTESGYETSKTGIPDVIPSDQNIDQIRPMVCRPLVGEITRGGGFIGLWRRKNNDSTGF